MIWTKQRARWVSWKAPSVAIRGCQDGSISTMLVEVDGQRMSRTGGSIAHEAWPAALAAAPAASAGRPACGPASRRPSLPVGAVEQVQLRRVDQGLVEEGRFGGQPVEGRRLDPRVAVRAR